MLKHGHSRGVPNWVRMPDEQTWYWHWNGDDYSVPHIYSVMASLTGETKYFVAYPDSRWCKDMGGWWLKIARPNIPSREWLTRGSRHHQSKEAQ
jgi:hypothetical protein